MKNPLVKIAAATGLAFVLAVTAKALALDAATADRLDALSTKLALVRLQSGKADLPAAVVANVRKTVDAADKKATNGYERQAVIASAGNLLTDAGLVQEPDTLLLA